MISELKKSTLSSYRDKAYADAEDRMPSAFYDNNNSSRKKKEEKIVKRLSNVRKASSKLTKEDLDMMSAEGIAELIENIGQLDELSRKTLAMYTAKAAADARSKTASAKDLESESKYYRDNAAGSGVESHMRKVSSDLKNSSKKADDKAQKRMSGVFKAASRLATNTRVTKEEAETIEELSKDTLKSYTEKSAKSAAEHESTSNMFGRAGWIGAMLKADKKSSQRKDGIKKATSRLTKEEIEAIEELSKDTLMSYYNKSAIDAYDHSRKSLDAFDAGDKETDDKHFKKMNSRFAGMHKATRKGNLTKKDINLPKDIMAESCKVGDPVIVRTAQGDKEGKVNDITNTHIGVKHPNVKGIIHYHPEYVKKNVKEDVDETLIEGVSWERWERSHAGSKEVKKSNRGQWMISKHKDGYRYGHKEGEDHITVNGTGKEAAQKGAEWAKEKGHHTAYVLESFLAEEKKSDFTLSSIANSALTTNRGE